GQKHTMQDGVWFRAAMAKRKNAEARWLLPMICRRGGITKQDIGAIRILDTTTEFEISAAAAQDFAAQIKRPDQDDNIRIEPLIGAKPIAPREERPVGKAPYERKSERATRHSKRPDSWSPQIEPLADPRRADRNSDDRPRRKSFDEPRAPRGGHEAGSKDAGSRPGRDDFKKTDFKKDGFKKEGFKKDGYTADGFKKKPKTRDDKPAYVSKARRADPSAKSPSFKKNKKKFRG
ncbi:DbpA RNA binding domain-containing protein, partial [Rhodopseudomonas sp. B29]|uniref:DbpA RNA binding domain-containing protein n=1 Tax=Rhodopseudomonas sp. B29 TaxID=95607 RepID=UPI0004CF32F4